MVKGMNSYGNFTQAYVDLCRIIRDESEFVSSPRGMKIKEKLGVQFRIKNPRDRLPYIEARNFSLSYFVAETLWYMSGEDSTEWISHYAPFWKDISDDGKTANSAYGARIFRRHDRIGNNQIVQWDYVKEELRKDPDSRRAVIHIRTPDDSIHASKDVPCTLALQFFIREGKLHLHVNMRSSDIILGIAYDIPAFTTMQEVLANELEIELGEYVHTSNSLHCYERDFEMLDAIARSSDNLGRPMPAYPRFFPTTDLMRVEEQVHRMTGGELLDGFASISFVSSDAVDDPVTRQLVNDWKNILCSFKARKMKDLQLSKRCLLSTDHTGYHFFKR
jgi:thymidylate synthase